MLFPNNAMYKFENLDDMLDEKSYGESTGKYNCYDIMDIINTQNYFILASHYYVNQTLIYYYNNKYYLCEIHITDKKIFSCCDIDKDIFEQFITEINDIGILLKNSNINTIRVHNEKMYFGLNVQMSLPNEELQNEILKHTCILI